MPALRGNGAVPSLPPPRPKSPPEYPDLYGKRRELAKLQVLEREIGFLEEEVRYVEGLQPASRSCQEVTEFVTCNADPLVPTAKKIRTSGRFWKWLCGFSSCCNVSWVCRCRCCCCCSSNLEKPCCCHCPSCSCSNPCVSCSRSCCWNSQCFTKSKCSWNCCRPKCPSCLTCCRIRHRCCRPKCPKINMCSCCNKNCCYSFCFWF